MAFDPNKPYEPVAAFDPNAEFELEQPGSGSAVYGDTGLPVTVGQERNLQAAGGLQPAFDVGTSYNPRFQAPGGPAPETGTYIDPRGRTVSPATEPLSKTLLAAGLRTATGIRMPSQRLDALESGAMSGLLLGGKNEFLAGAAALGEKLRGGDFTDSFTEGLGTLDDRDRVQRETYPAEWYGSGILGGAAGAALTPEVKGAQALVDGGVGAASGFLSSDGDLKERALAGAMGGALGGGLSAVTRAQPRLPQRAQGPRELLMAEGVPLTPGQAVGGRGFESMMTSIPVIGGGIKKAEDRAIDGLNRAAINRALKPIGQSLPKKVPVGHEGVAYSADVISKGYDDVLAPVTLIPDADFGAAIAAIRADAEEIPGIGAALDSIIRNRIEKRASSGQLTGREWKQIDSELAAKSRAYSRSLDPLNHEGADLIDDMRGAMRDLLERSAPDVAPEVRKLNEAFANQVRVERAARRAEGGRFTPAQLDSAVAMSDASSRGAHGARGKALMQDLSNAARVVMKPYPDSGTAGRTLNALAPVVGVGGAITNLPATLAAGAALGSGRLAYSTGAAGSIARGVTRPVNKARNLRLDQKTADRLARIGSRGGGHLVGILGQ